MRNEGAPGPLLRLAVVAAAVATGAVTAAATPKSETARSAGASSCRCVHQAATATAASGGRASAEISSCSAPIVPETTASTVPATPRSAASWSQGPGEADE